MPAALYLDYGSCAVISIAQVIRRLMLNAVTGSGNPDMATAGILFARIPRQLSLRSATYSIRTLRVQPDYVSCVVFEY